MEHILNEIKKQNKKSQPTRFEEQSLQQNKGKSIDAFRYALSKSIFTPFLLTK